MKKTTIREVKYANKTTVCHYIYEMRSTSKHDIIQELHLSRPTVNQILSDLEKSQLIHKSGFFDSTGGRKPEIFSFCPNFKIALGLELLKNSYEITAINLYGEVLKTQQYSLPFSNTPAYFQTICTSVLSFAQTLEISMDSILGIGIVLQGLISSDGTCVTYGKILDCTGLSVTAFSQHLPFPCQMLHDAESAANMELWEFPDITDAIFFHIRENMSGAFIVNGRFLPGKELKSGVFEHMTLIPNGNPCYCGKNGCVEAYCSLKALLKPQESIKNFIYHLRQGHPAYKERWLDYLKNLSCAIDNLYMVIDYDIILGGILGQYLIPEDIQILYSYFNKRTAFPSSRDFIKIGRTAALPISKGAALPFIKKFLNLFF